MAFLLGTGTADNYYRQKLFYAKDWPRTTGY